MAERPSSEGGKIDAASIIEAQLFTKAEARQRVITRASRVIDILSGSDTDIQVLPIHIGAEVASAPHEVPALAWQTFSVIDGVGVRAVGNIGEYYAGKFTNESPSAVFNSGFYAGVLAAKAGLINPEDYHHETEQ